MPTKNRPLIVIIIGAVLLFLALSTASTNLTFAQSNSVNFSRNRLIYVDPDGQNLVPFVSSYQTDTATFTLYELDDSALISLYSSWDFYNPPDPSGRAQVATWEQDLSNQQSFSSTTALPDVPSGHYLLTATAPGSEMSSILVNVSRHALLLKESPTGQITVWASLLQTGVPSAAMALQAYDAQGNPLVQGTTDATGIATLATDPNLASNEKPFIIVGKLGNEIALAGIGSDWAENYWYGYTKSNRYSTYLYTDRPIYRPGHTVHYAAVLKEFTVDGYASIAQDVPIEARLYDSRGNLITTTPHTIDEFGMLSGDFVLGDEPPLGTYKVHLRIGPEATAETFIQEFSVEEYRKPEYAVEVASTVDYVIQGEEIPLTLSADYFFGQPVADADVTLKIYQDTLYRYDWYGYYDGGSTSAPIATLTGKTDANGRWSTTIQTETQTGSGSIYNQRYRFVATVTDAASQAIDGSASVPAYRHPFRLSASTQKYGYEAGEAVVIDVKTRTHADQPLASKQVMVAIERNGYREDSEIVAQQEATTNSEGAAELTFTDLSQGWYRIIVSAPDDRGNFIETNSWLWIFDPNSHSWWYTNDADLSIEADQTSYAPGDVAHLLIQSKVTETVALVTLERETVLQEIVVNITGPATQVDIPITESLAPNVVAKVHLYQHTTEQPADDYYYEYAVEAKLLTASTTLNIPANHRRLTVDIAPDAADYAAGSEATLTINLTDHLGQPAAGRVMLALVDEAIFALAPDNSGDIFDTFHGARQLQVNTFSSLTPFSSYGPELALPTSGEIPPEAPADDGRDQADSGADTQPRRVFLDTAYWNPTIDTDANGQAVVKVPLPDNLTTWRIIARAITSDTDAGQATGQLLVTQELIARPTLPRFGIQGDSFLVGMVGQNFSGQESTGQASLQATNLILLDPATRALDLPNGKATTADWTAVASQIGTGVVTSSLTSAVGADIVELPFTVNPFSVPERLTASGQANPMAKETFVQPPNAVYDASKFTLSMAPSIAVGLLDDLDSLIDYPYGCVEQTMSRLLPSAAASIAYNDLNIPNPKAELLPEIMNKGLQKLYGYQLENGAWGWFTDDEAGYYLTTYVLNGIIMVQKAGFATDEQVVERGFSYLSQTNTTDPNMMAYAAYVSSMAGREPSSQAEALAQNPDLDAFGLAMVSIALHIDGKEAAAQSALDRLLTKVEEAGGKAFWPIPETEKSWYHWRSMASTEKNTAAAIQAVVALRPGHPVLPKAVQWLMEQRQNSPYGGAGWRNTQATAFAISGLSGYLRVSNELVSDYAYAVILNDVEIASGRVTPDVLMQPIDPVMLSGDSLRIGENELRIERRDVDGASGIGPLYYALLVEQELFYDSFQPVSSVTQGLSVNRTYRLVDESVRASDRLADSSLHEDEVYKVGNLVEVEVTVQAKYDMAYVLVSDPIPAGFEAVRERMNVVSYSDYWFDSPFFWREWGYNRKELRDDSVDLFITNLWEGTRTYTYLMRATTPGEFSVLPALAYPMYEPEIWGRSQSKRVIVSPEALTGRPALTGDFDRSCQITAFDAQQVAAAWGSTNSSRDISDDGLVNLQDVAAIAMRRGATCLNDRPAPGTASGEARFVLNMPEQTLQAGEQFEATFAFEGGTFGRGFGATLNFDQSKLRIANVRWHTEKGKMLPLGPNIRHLDGALDLGAFDLPETIQPGDNLVTITLTALTAGTADLTVSSAQATDSAGNLISATAQRTGGPITIQGSKMYMPVVRN